ncbi:Cx9C motif-containing protein 4, mitochondrial [Leucoagaricus sp. SymC.cos]|nr:Cx9C motif-containing protein 4, mitochondrial [Leucoagaricus sp. SymC.cos]
MRQKNACQAEACDLQSCLNRSTYKPDKCDPLLRRLYECCHQLYIATDGKGESTACPKAFVVERWLKDHPTK